MPKSPDPTKDPAFQSVVQHFLKTKPQPFTPKKEKIPSMSREAVIARMLKTPPTKPKKGKASPKPPKARIQRHQGR